MATSEVITLMILFHLSGYRTIKHFYTEYVQVHLTHLFPRTVSYTRFTKLMQLANLPLALFLRTQRMGESTGISFIDSTPIPVCKNKRIFTHKVFDGLAAREKSTMGYFTGSSFIWSSTTKVNCLPFS